MSHKSMKKDLLTATGKHSTIVCKNKALSKKKRVVILFGVPFHIQIGGHSRCGHIPEHIHGKVII